MQGVVLETGGMVIDVNDIVKEAAFWGAMLGEEPGPRRSGGGWLTVGSLSSNTQFVLQKVPEAKLVKNRCHMCFFVADVDEAVRRVEALGGSLLSGPRPGGGVTMADPEGNEFCIGSFNLRRTKEGHRIRLRK